MMEEEDVGWNRDSYKYIEDHEVAGNKVGDFIEQTASYVLVLDAIDCTKILHPSLTSLSNELNCLKLQLDLMGKDDDLMEAIINELKGIYLLVADCKALVRKCSGFFSWKFNETHKASDELLQFSSRLQRCRIDLEHTSARWMLLQLRDEVVTGCVVGGLVTQTAILIEEAISITKSFSDRLRRILPHMKTLQSKFDTMGDNDQMNLPNEELRPIYDFLRRPCKILMFKCIKFPRDSSYIEKEKYCEDLDHLDNELASFCNTIDLSYMIDSKEIKDEIVVESGGYGMNKLCLDEQVTETENIKGLEDVPFNDDIHDHDRLDGPEPDVMVESTASPGESGKSTSVSDEQVTAISYEYDVFLSFRGDDTRESFTSTLFYALSKVYKIKTFMDVIFRKGSKLEDLLKMIEKSRMSIVVFSENFAESEWCLKELAKIFEESDRRGHEILPVFYKVNPSELRHQNSGKTKGHMEKHHNTYGKDSDTVKSWSNAMKELGNSSGYTYWSGRGKQEIELAEEIAQEILNRLHG